MSKILYKIVDRNEHCVLLRLIQSDNKVFKVIDIENDVIAMGSYEHCRNVFDEYDINAVRNERKKLFEDWLKVFAEA